MQGVRVVQDKKAKRTVPHVCPRDALEANQQNIRIRKRAAGQHLADHQNKLVGGQLSSGWNAAT